MFKDQFVTPTPGQVNHDLFMSIAVLDNPPTNMFPFSFDARACSHVKGVNKEQRPCY